MSASYVQEGASNLNPSGASARREVARLAERDGQPLIITGEPHRTSVAEEFAAVTPEPAARWRPVEFAHPSEEEFARILDFYQIAWQYEPRTFAIEWDDEGNFVNGFTPDFYLPEYDLYIELTTLKQKLVTAKNRKVRLLRRHYPDVKIKLFYGSDYRKLLEKFAANGAWQAPEPDEEFTQI